MSDTDKMIDSVQGPFGRIRGLAILLLPLACIAVLQGIANAEPDKAAYELQERCGKRAAEIFRQENPKSRGGTAAIDGSSITTYRNHYNAKLNHCFMLSTYTAPGQNAGEAYKAKTLLNVNENDEIGSMAGFYKIENWRNWRPMDCQVAGRVCSSEAQWDSLAAPYMTE